MFGRALCPVAWDDSVLKVLSRHSPESCYFFLGGGIVGGDERIWV